MMKNNHDPRLYQRYVHSYIDINDNLVRTLRSTIINCPFCGNNLEYLREFDAHICIRCNIWVEPRCKDPGCSWYAGKPSTPIEFFMRIERKLNRDYYRECYQSRRKKRVKRANQLLLKARKHKPKGRPNLKDHKIDLRHITIDD